MTPQEVAENLKKNNTLPGALSIAESLLKKIKDIKAADLPDLGQIAQDSHISDTMKKDLIKRERSKLREVERDRGFWQNVVGILRKQQKA